MGALQDLYGTGKVKVISIIKQGSASAVKPYARGNSALFLIDATGSVFNDYSIGGYPPLNYVIKQDGKVYNGMEGFSETTLKSWIDSCIITGIEDKNKELRVESTELRVIKDKIYLGVAKAMDAELKIYDLCGRIREVVYEGILEKGSYEFNAKIKMRGIYFVTLESNNYKTTRKLVMMSR
ncbi:MAG: T9SS type A sorting domain-containing protein [bacterium]